MSMKTLDEVIEIIETAIELSYADSQMVSIYEDDAVDAFHYLQEYREISKALNPKVRTNEHVG